MPVLRYNFCSTANENTSLSTGPVDPFDRSTSGGLFTVMNYAMVANTDIFPPAKIQDLSLVAMSYDNNTIVLEWTATGEDLDQGGPGQSIYIIVNSRSLGRARIAKSNWSLF